MLALITSQPYSYTVSDKCVEAFLWLGLNNGRFRSMVEHRNGEIRAPKSLTAIRSLLDHRGCTNSEIYRRVLPISGKNRLELGKTGLHIPKTVSCLDIKILGEDFKFFAQSPNTRNGFFAIRFLA